MAANIFGRYVWLIEQFRHYGRLTYEEINDHWHKSGLSYGDNDDLACGLFIIIAKPSLIFSRSK